jgi:transposase InsO family protein
LIEKAVISQKLRGKPVVLHSDNGGPMKGATFQATMERLGLIKSYSRPRVSNDNPYSESLFKTLKYCPQYPKSGFETLEDAREWVYLFVKWYYEKHMHSGINYVTPRSRHEGKDKLILEKRKRLYEAYKNKNPSRWSKTTRNWNHVKSVSLNPINEKENSEDIA